MRVLPKSSAATYLAFLNVGFVISIVAFSAAGIQLYIGASIYLFAIPAVLYRWTANGRQQSAIAIDGLVLAFIVVNAISVIFVWYGEVSARVFLSSCFYILFPILFYFPFSFCSRRVNESDAFLRAILGWSLVLILAGIYLQFAPPDGYKNYITQINGENYLADGQLLPRMYSYVNSSVVGAVAALSVPPAFYFLRKRRGALIASIVVLFTGCMLSLARASWIAFFLVLFTSSIYYKVAVRLILSLAIAAASIAAVLWLQPDLSNATILQILSEKLSASGEEAFAERSTQYEFAWKTISENPGGAGLGAFNHKSEREVRITDANYHRIFAENGWLGGTLFLTILASSFFLALQRRSEICFIYLLMLAVYSFVMIGTNIIDYNYTSNIFWTLLGLLSHEIKQHSAKRAR